MSVNKPRGNTQRQKPEEAAAPRFRVSLDWEHIFTSPKNTLAWGTFFIVLGLILETSFFSYIVTGLSDQSVLDGLGHQSIRDAGRQTRNFLGVLGAVVSHIFVYRWFGLGALLLPVVPFVAGWKMAFGREILPLSRATKEVIFFTLWVSVLMGYIILMSNTENTLSFLSGGFGYLVNVSLFDWLKWGSVLPILFSLFVFAVFFYDVRDRYESWQAKHAKPEAAAEESQDETPAPAVPEEAAVPESTFVSVVNDTYDDEVLAPEEQPDSDLDTEEEAPRVVPHPAVVLPVTPQAPAVPAASTSIDLPVMPMEVSAVPSEPLLELEVEDTTQVKETGVEEFEDEDVNASILREFGQYDPMLDLPSYHFPTIDLLNEVFENQHEKVSQEELESNKTKIVDTLGSYGINISKIKATIGPTVTLYEIIPEAGVRISKIKNLEGDIALSLAALGIRIIAPMPGRGTIGIEVPNKNRETVFARSVLANDRFQKSTYDLPIVLGKTISNDIHIADLAKMPHLLMAGATGQGKSVGLNVILASLIYKKHPAELKFVLVDPKKVELTLFNKLERHFLAKLPNAEEAIITDTKKVIFTLNSLCIEMDSRYDLLKEAAVRNLKEYNAKFAARRLNPEKGHRFLPYIVLVIDELADLMMTAGKEVETPIARLAQLARAVGIHLVVATQRPSVKVITGLIKANFPARLSFRVTSSIDSRTILDMGGAEQLVGQGDMLLAINSEVIRLQCPFIDTREIEDICEYIGGQRGYDEAYALPEYEGEDAAEGKAELNPDDFDSLLPDAARLIVTHQQGSTSLIQRKMKLGYNRAGRIMDQLEVLGVVGPFTGSKARDVMFHDLNMLEEHLRVMGVN
ncbi:S-DNA-T family DNA segregation ATPase FtsK/SpoIIIE [Dyadobacter sp. BE34]|uniref:S-DNA-T family DNA segregation ATPase FtsK/SpoIIIE n=1 Tax=Dyadobacter fermentans TaxID=94254 RepID=A0ABU1R4N4_9BACT|nr:MULTISPECIES: DNA translocase FtsK [Dyadobacter]MDR6808379.1 S-DNA-T family DNA segregation ATPase FtsK/SpoIIIE [Dyadobacter fermentans]MDR7045804.1 S-DNA-T family DNA segregation ATPase FtsK/SpoIIIE [Dyadobacter sp. BE242]MDR7200117.1 S-DNA-T family DNA segregation ATPase FtsK/SpoIIIE [Dyadobacter sp. BE34]MDR7218077.1 S-DNA-T family DNA segregation ATPase FtsK/SpoIIIE [Dyadobacter sp. BE31]MDR7266008.1 S-DNA-T family DNA segregation ATPase FtsK/SpoIIIE [Dyadobacter sp. BE32]